MLQPATLPAGHRLGGRYEILRVLGIGGSAVVYAARDGHIGDDIALKVLRPEKSSDVMIRRSRREAGIARGLSHPGLVRVFEWHEIDGMICLPMELVTAGSLRDLLRSGLLPVDRAVALSTEILDALAVLHAHEIVHRDVKPGNLLMTSDGRVKLSDFGIARRWTSDESALTRGDIPLGTVDYLSPEQAAGKAADPQSDLYSFGIVLFEMLTGRVPFARDSALGAIVARLQEPAPDVRTLRAEVPAWLASIVARLLERDVATRYTSANDVLGDLHSRRATTRRRDWFKIVLLLVAIALVAAAAVKFLSPTPLPTLVADGDWGVKAIDAGGRVLWSRRDVRFPRIALVHRGSQHPEYATILSDDPTRVDASLQTLSFLDPATGRLLRQVRLPSSASTFTGFSPYFGVHQVIAFDIDADGFDEIIVSYSHATYWPSFTVMHDPKRSSSRILMVASGHHYVADAHDLDGDGHKELIFTGVSNRMGWHFALAAMRVALDDPDSDSIASTPDAMYTRPSRDPLLWYALAPPGVLPNSRAVEIDGPRRRIRLKYLTRAPFEVTFDGFTEARGDPRGRNRERESAYAHLRESVRLNSVAFPEEAASEALKAREIARRIGDPALGTWAGRLRAKALVQAGHTAEATALFDELAALPDISGDLAFDAARSLHLAGNLDEAIAWYRRGLGPNAKLNVGRLKWEFLEGLVFALGERGRWSEALREAAQFDRAYANEAGVGQWHSHYIQWRLGARPEPLPVHQNTHDVHRYWSIEFRMRRGEDAARLLDEVALQKQATSGSKVLLQSVESELLWHLGRRDDARRVAREALEQARTDRNTETEVRAHFDLIAARHEKMQ